MFPTHRAFGSVAARVAVALLHLQLTVDPREAWQTGARVAALPRVHAGGAVHTGMVMGAEVQIWGGDKSFRLHSGVRRRKQCLPGMRATLEEMKSGETEFKGPVCRIQ